MKNAFLAIVLLISGLSAAQSINEYQYVVIPRKFEFLKDDNKYNLNTLTKMLFEKQGFKVFYEDDIKPDELALDRCKALYGNLVNDSGMLSTVLQISLKDCKGNTIFLSEKGKSKEKEFHKAYYEALREASVSLTALNYKYSGEQRAATPLQTRVKEPMRQNNVPAATQPTTNAGMLYAQPVANGYQLVDSTPKVVLKMYKTSQKDSYTAVSDTKNGVVFKKGDEWIFEYYQNEQLVSEKLNIKF